MLGVAKGTVTSRIQLLAKALGAPSLEEEKATFEVDELWTYIGARKMNTG